MPTAPEKSAHPSKHDRALKHNIQQILRDRSLFDPDLPDAQIRSTLLNQFTMCTSHSLDPDWQFDDDRVQKSWVEANKLFRKAIDKIINATEPIDPKSPLLLPAVKAVRVQLDPNEYDRRLSKDCADIASGIDTLRTAWQMLEKALRLIDYD